MSEYHWIEKNDKLETWDAWYKTVLGGLTPDCAFKAKVMTKVSQIKKGDILFHYVNQVGFIGLSEVVSELELVKNVVSERDNLYPLRIGIKLLVHVTEKLAVNFRQINVQSANPGYLNSLITGAAPIAVTAKGLSDISFVEKELYARKP